MILPAAPPSRAQTASQSRPAGRGPLTRVESKWPARADDPVDDVPSQLVCQFPVRKMPNFSLFLPLR